MSIIRILIIVFIIFVFIRSFRKIYEVLRGDDSLSPEKESKNSKSDPYEILEIARGATSDEIRRAYLAKLAQYHPDKVNHLGDDLQKLAREKTLEIQEAYQAISK